MISDYKLARSTAINFLTGGKNIEELSSNNIQLEEEIKNGDWLLTPASSKFIFNVPHNKITLISFLGSEITLRWTTPAIITNNGPK